MVRLATEDPPVEPTRSFLMSKVRSKNSKPEVIVRQALHKMGYRFRLHAQELPGRPDIVFRNRKKAIFVHGCFWHRHPGCRKATDPKTRRDFWQSKFEANVRRDTKVQKDLQNIGWDYLLVWECEIKCKDELIKKLKAFLDKEPN
jgi:DNA mismatch endonuclease (patch repair protein)